MRWPADLKRLSPLLLAGDGALELAHEAAEFLLSRGDRIVLVDGANAFDAYSLARAAQRRRKPAPSLLAAIRVSRAFTWQQFETLLERDAAAEAARTGARWALVLGPLDLLADEEVKPFQAWRAAKRVADALTALAANGLGVIAAQRPDPLRRAKREELTEFLHRACGHQVEVEHRGDRKKELKERKEPEDGRERDVDVPESAEMNGVSIPAGHPISTRPVAVPDTRQLALPFSARGG